MNFFAKFRKFGENTGSGMSSGIFEQFRFRSFPAFRFSISADPGLAAVPVLI